YALAVGDRGWRRGRVGRLISFEAGPRRLRPPQDLAGHAVYGQRIQLAAFIDHLLAPGVGSSAAFRAGKKDEVAENDRRRVSERNRCLPNHILLRSKLRWHAGRITHTAAVWPAELGPVSGEGSACNCRESKNPAKHSPYNTVIVLSRRRTAASERAVVRGMFGWSRVCSSKPIWLSPPARASAPMRSSRPSARAEWARCTAP